MSIKLCSSVILDPVTEQVSRAFDYIFDGTTTTIVPEIPCLPTDYSVGLIVGPSGSGKSTLLKSLGINERVEWREGYSVASHFSSSAEAAEKLAGAGLNSLPAWCRSFDLLSTGEKFRADVARQLFSGSHVDEFTSVVDRVVAKSCSVAASRYIRNRGLKHVIFASCHYDIIEWLSPDWVYDTVTGVVTPRGLLQGRPSITLEVLPSSSGVWPLFSKHHYLTEEINKGAKCWVAVWNDVLVGFASALAFPNGNFTNAWREHRTVILPDFQGLGLGVRLSDTVGALMRGSGKRYFSKTAHPRMGGYRDANPHLWRATFKNRRDRQDYKHGRSTKESKYKHLHANRTTWSHEYIGPSC